MNLEPRIRPAPRVAAACVVVASLCLLAPRAEALPALRDYWHFTCAPNGVTRKILEQSQAKAGSGGGVGDLRAACVQSALEVDQFQKRLAKFQEGGSKGAAPQLDHRRSDQMLAGAERSLAATYKAKKTPEIAFHYGLALALKADDWSINRLDEAIREGSAAVSGEASLVMAEIYFDKQDLQKASQNYAKAAASKRKPTQEYARYKLGWMEYIGGVQAKNKGLQKSAIQKLAKLTRTKSPNAKPKGVAARAKEDVLAMIVDLGDLEAAKQILQSVNATEVYGTLLERMAYTRLAEGNTKAAYDLFGLAVKERPSQYGSLELSINQAVIAAQTNNVPLLVWNLKALVRTYVQPKASWRKKQNEADLKKADARVEAVVLEYASAIDQQGRANKSLADQKQAELLYKIVLTYFPKSSKIYDVKFAQAQLLFVMLQYEASARALAAMVKETPKGKYTKDALELMVTAAQTAVDGDKTKYDIPAPGKGTTELKIPAVKQTYADSLDLFVKYMPQHQLAIDAQFAAASVYYDFAHYEEGVKRYNAFIKKYPTNAYAKTLVARIIEYHKSQNDPEALEAAKAEINAIPALAADPQLKPLLAPDPKAVAAAGSAKGKGKDKKAAKGKKGKKAKKIKPSEDEEFEDEADVETVKDEFEDE
jgi:hypothetical protein